MAVWQAENVVKEPILLIPHSRVPAQVRHRRGNPQEVFAKLEGHVSIIRVCHRQLDGDLQHVLAEQCHPGCTISLLQAAPRWQWSAAIEDPDVVETQVAPFEDIPPRTIFAIDPPGKVQEKFLKIALEPVPVPFTFQRFSSR